MTLLLEISRSYIWQEAQTSRLGGRLRQQQTQVADLNERIYTFTHKLDKFFTNKCVGPGNQLDETLKAYKLKPQSTKKADRCATLASHLARNGIPLSDVIT